MIYLAVLVVLQNELSILKRVETGVYVNMGNVGVVLGVVFVLQEPVFVFKQL